MNLIRGIISNWHAKIHLLIIETALSSMIKADLFHKLAYILSSLFNMENSSFLIFHNFWIDIIVHDLGKLFCFKIFCYFTKVALKF